VDDARIVADDDDGGKYSYRDEGFPDQVLEPKAELWFGVCPRAE
jgi:hypothetical protein